MYIIAEDSPLGSTSKELKLLQMGGHGGRPRGEISEWDYFSSPSEQTRMIENLKLSDNERERNNRKAFTSIVNIIDDVNVEKHDESNNRNNRGTHTLCNLQKIESALNKNLTCDYHIGHLIADFIIYVIEKNSTLYRVKELYKSYKKDNKKIDKSKIIIKDRVISIATSIDIACSRCHQT